MGGTTFFWGVKKPSVHIHTILFFVSKITTAEPPYPVLDTIGEGRVPKVSRARFNREALQTYNNRLLKSQVVYLLRAEALYLHMLFTFYTHQSS